MKITYSENFPISQITIDELEFQPRDHYDERYLNALAKDIKLIGQLDPIVLWKNDDTYQLLAGFCRTKAISNKLHHSVIRATIYEDITEEQAHRIAISSNQKRFNFTDKELAGAVYSAGGSIEEKGELFFLKEHEVHNNIFEAKCDFNEKMRKIRVRDSPIKPADKHRLSLLQKSFLFYTYLTSKQDRTVTILGFRHKTRDTAYYDSTTAKAVNNLILQGLIRRKKTDTENKKCRNYQYVLGFEGERLVKTNYEKWYALIEKEPKYDFLLYSTKDGLKASPKITVFKEIN